MLHDWLHMTHLEEVRLAQYSKPEGQLKAIERVKSICNDEANTTSCKLLVLAILAAAHKRGGEACNMQCHAMAEVDQGAATRMSKPSLPTFVLN